MSARGHLVSFGRRSNGWALLAALKRAGGPRADTGSLGQFVTDDYKPLPVPELPGLGTHGRIMRDGCPLP